MCVLLGFLQKTWAIPIMNPLSWTNGHISVLSEIHILFPYHLILTGGPILITENHQRVVLS